jgi:hypothetical protein
MAVVHMNGLLNMIIFIVHVSLLIWTETFERKWVSPSSISYMNGNNINSKKIFSAGSCSVFLPVNS